jgi:hypothetical protein
VSAQEEGKEQCWPQEVNKPLIERLEPRGGFLLVLCVGAAGYVQVFDKLNIDCKQPIRGTAGSPEPFLLNAARTCHYRLVCWPWLVIRRALVTSTPYQNYSSHAWMHVRQSTYPVLQSRQYLTAAAKSKIRITEALQAVEDAFKNHTGVRRRWRHAMRCPG